MLKLSVGESAETHSAVEFCNWALFNCELSVFGMICCDSVVFEFELCLLL